MSVEKVPGGYENVGKDGGHGVMKTKAEAERQKAAMFAKGFKPKRMSHAEFKAKLHDAVSKAYDAHVAKVHEE
jgi:hypothetical protein